MSVCVPHKGKTIGDSPSLQEELETLDKWKINCQMSLNVSKCTSSACPKRKSRSTMTTPSIPWTNHKKGFQTIISTSVEITEDLNWGAHSQATAVKTNKISAFTHCNHKDNSTTTRMSY